MLRNCKGEVWWIRDLENSKRSSLCICRFCGHSKKAVDSTSGFGMM